MREYEALEGKWNGLSTNPVSEDGYRIAIRLERDSVAADTQVRGGVLFTK